MCELAFPSNGTLSAKLKCPSPRKAASCLLKLRIGPWTNGTAVRDWLDGPAVHPIPCTHSFITLRKRYTQRRGRGRRREMVRENKIGNNKSHSPPSSPPFLTQLNSTHQITTEWGCHPPRMFLINKLDCCCGRHPFQTSTYTPFQSESS